MAPLAPSATAIRTWPMKVSWSTPAERTAQGAPAAAAVVAAYQASGGPAQIWRDLYTDLVFRAPMLHLLGRSANAGTPAWAYEFAHPIASAGGGRSQSL